MKKNTISRDEKRRLQLKKRRKHSVFRNRLLVTMIAIVFVFTGVISLLVSAYDGADYAAAPVITFTNGTYRVPAGGLDAGLYKYSVGSKTYVFTVENHIPEASDITLTTNSDGTYNVVYEQDPTANAENILDYANLTSSNSGSSYSFEMKNYLTDDTGDIITGDLSDPDDEDPDNGIYYYDNNPKRLVLEAGKTYYYRDDSSNKYYYLIPEEDFGYEYVETRVAGIYQPENAGDLAFTLTVGSDGSGTWSGSGNYYTRKVIYERASQLLNNHVYLITAIPNNSGSTEYMIRYTDSKYWKDLYDNYTMSGGILPKCPNWHYFGQDAGDGNRGNGEWVYRYGVESGIPETINPSFYVKNSNGSFSSYTANYYYDGEDGNFQEDSDDSYYDRYIYSEFATYTKAIPRGLFATIATLLSGNAGVVLMAYDGNGSANYYDKSSSGGDSTGYYTSNKALGGIYTANSSAGRTLLIHKMCTEGLIAHNYGSVWTYDYSSKTMRNKNSALGSLGFPSYLSYGSYSSNIIQFGSNDMEENQENGKEYRISYNATGIVNNNIIQSDIYIYEMRTVFTKDTKAESGDINSSDITATVTPHELEDVTVTLSYTGTNIQNPNKEFDVTFTLVDDNGDPVSGKWSTNEFTFTDGAYQTTMKNGDSIPFTNIPEGYALNVSVTLPDGSGEENTLYYSTTIDGQDVTTQDFTITEDKTIPIVVTSLKELVTVTNHTEDTPGQDYADTNKKFPLKLTLFESDGVTPASGSYVGTDGTTYSFGADGICTNTVELADQESISLYLPKNMVLKVEDAQSVSDYSTTYTDPNTQDSSDPLNTSISNNNIQVVVTHTREQVVITGVQEENGNNLLAILGVAIGTGMIAVAYVFLKKRLEGTEA